MIEGAKPLLERTLSKDYFEKRFEALSNYDKIQNVTRYYYG